MTPNDPKPFDMSLGEVAELLMKTPSALYKQIQREKVGDLPIYNVGTTGTGKRYAARVSLSASKSAWRLAATSWSLAA